MACELRQPRPHMTNAPAHQLLVRLVDGLVECSRGGSSVTRRDHTHPFGRRTVQVEDAVRISRILDTLVVVDVISHAEQWRR